jgi:hypothetical protein
MNNGFFYKKFTKIYRSILRKQGKLKIDDMKTAIPEPYPDLAPRILPRAGVVAPAVWWLP